MRKMPLLGIFREWNDFLIFQIRQSLVITVGKRATHYFFHNRCFITSLEFFERVVVSGPIDEFDVDGHIAFADKQIVVNRSANPAITVNKWVRVLEGQV